MTTLTTKSLLTTATTSRRPVRDYRPAMVFVLVIAVLIIGFAVSRIPGRGVDAAAVMVDSTPARSGFESLGVLQPQLREEVSETLPPLEKESQPTRADGAPAQKIFKQARALIRAKKHEEALILLNEARPLLQNHAEAYFLIGNVLERKKDFDAARDFYNAALNRNPSLSEAHWGFATTSEALGDLESALGGMRSYLHTEPDPDPMRLRINQARSAIWEWESKLGRGPWGPTRGIPPGFIAEDLKRDGRGVGVKWPLVETLQPDGSMKSEVKTANKIKIYPRP